MKPFAKMYASSTTKPLQLELLSRVRNREAVLIDVRQFHRNITLVRNSIWLGPFGIPGGWSCLLNPHYPHVILEDSERQPSKSAQKHLLATGMNTVLGTINTSISEIQAAGIETYQPKIAKSVVQQGYVTLDVRRPDEWAQGIIEGNVRMKEVRELARDTSCLSKEVKYITQCKMGIRSIMAYTLLEKDNFECKVYLGTWSSIVSSGIPIKKP